METKNARISRTTLGIEDHGIMSFWIFLEWQGGGQVLGGFALDSHKKDAAPIEYDRVGWGAGIIAIRHILETVGVDSWEELRGQLVRVKVEGLGSSRPPIIGNIIKDSWFDMQEFAKANQ